MSYFAFLLPALLSVQALFAAVESYPVQNYSHLFGMAGFSDSLLQMHFKLYEGYVKNANDLLAKLKAISDAGSVGSYEYGALKRRLGWEFDGMRLHELYFGNLGGNGSLDPKSALSQAITAQFGSYDQWKSDFIATGAMRGIGWAVLYLDPVQKRLLNTWINEHDVGHLAGGAPILVMDVFEHAYMPQYGLDRAKYMDAFFKNIDWKTADARFTTRQ